MLDGSTSVETTKPVTANSDGRARRLANLRPIQKGQALNPRGRPKKDHDLAAMAQKHAELAVQTLAQCLTDPAAAWPSKVSAASELLDRGFGRAPQSLNVDHKVGFSEQFEQFLRQLSAPRQEKIIEHEEIIPESVGSSLGPRQDPEE